MPSDAFDIADLMSRWTHGWAASRSLEVTAHGATLRVEVQDTTRTVELMAAEPDNTLFAELADVTDEHTWLTVFAKSTIRFSTGSALQCVTTDEALMTCSIVPSARRANVLIDSDGIRCDGRIEVDGALAAVGSVAVNGTDAIFDRVETMPRFRRRGYGAALMAALGSAAHEHGARYGILAASADGRHLYGALGWSTRAQMISLSGRPRAAMPA